MAPLVVAKAKGGIRSPLGPTKTFCICECLTRLCRF